MSAEYRIGKVLIIYNAFYGLFAFKKNNSWINLEELSDHTLINDILTPSVYPEGFPYEELKEVVNAALVNKKGIVEQSEEEIKTTKSSTSCSISLDDWTLKELYVAFEGSTFIHRQEALNLLEDISKTKPDKDNFYNLGNVKIQFTGLGCNVKYLKEQVCVFNDMFGIFGGLKRAMIYIHNRNKSYDEMVVNAIN